MAKRGGGLRYNSEAELRAAFPHATILSDTGENKKLAKIVSHVVQEEAAVHDQLLSMVGHSVKISKEDRVFGGKKGKLLELSMNEHGGVEYAIVRIKGKDVAVLARHVGMAKGVGRYHANPQWYDGIHFKSEGEKDRYIFLKEAQARGLIRGLKVQPQYTLQPKFQCEILIADRIITESQVKKHGAISYSADFRYTVVATGIEWVEDYKTASKKTGKAYMTASSTRAIKQFLYTHPDIKFLINTQRDFLP